MPDGVAGEILHAFKYGGWPALAEPLGERLARVAAWPVGIVVPVPLAAARRRERGFNQSERLAAVVARRTGARLSPGALTRVRATRAQAKLTGVERAANVHAAFAVSGDAAPRLAGRHVTVVDDVLTTGATLNACADALFGAGVSGVSFLTVGRAHAPGVAP
jgi:ComF family protein